MSQAEPKQTTEIRWFSAAFDLDFEIRLDIGEQVSEDTLLRRIRPSRAYAKSTNQISKTDAESLFESKHYIEVLVPVEIYLSRYPIRRDQEDWGRNYCIDKFYITEHSLVTLDDFIEDNIVLRIGRLEGMALLREQKHPSPSASMSGKSRAKYPFDDDANLSELTFQYDSLNPPDDNPAKSNTRLRWGFSSAESPDQVRLEKSPSYGEKTTQTQAGLDADRSMSVFSAADSTSATSPRIDSAPVKAKEVLDKQKLDDDTQKSKCFFCNLFFIIILSCIIYLELNLLSAVTYAFAQFVVCYYRSLVRNRWQSNAISNVVGISWALITLFSLELGLSFLCVIDSKELLLSMLAVLTILTAIAATDRLFCLVQPVLVFLLVSAVVNSSFLCSFKGNHSKPATEPSSNSIHQTSKTGKSDALLQMDSNKYAPQGRETFFGNLASQVRERLFPGDDVSELELARMQRLIGDTSTQLHVLSELEGWFPSHRICNAGLRETESIYLGASAAFDRDSATLSDSAKTTARRVGKLLNRVSFSELLIVGHADTLGNQLYNQELSEKRARAFFEALIRETTLPPMKIRVIGRGDASPIFSPSTSLSSYNRRVELLVICEQRK